MLSFGSRRIFLATEPCDMRWGAPRLSGWVESRPGMQALAGDVFVFLGRDQRQVKILVWDLTGYWLCSKRLGGGRFMRPVPQVGYSGQATVSLSSAELGLLLEGISVHRATYSQHR